jgi:hypothetical protein
VPTYDLGDAIPLETRVRDADGNLAAATVALTLTRPDGTTFTSPTITNPSTGVYRAAPVPDVVGPNWAGVWSTSGAVISVTPFAFAVADPGPAAYTDLDTVKSALGKSTDDDRDDLILNAIAAASRQIDDRCGRYFYTDRAATARTFPARGRSTCVDLDQVLMVDDIAVATGVLVATGKTGSWTSVSGTELGPDNASVWGRPYTEIRGAIGWLPAYTRVQVTARWGWPTVPDAITQATSLLAARLYRRKDSPQGVLGNSEWGPTRVSRTDPDVEALIAPFVIPVIA